MVGMKWWEFLLGSLGVAAAAVLVMVYMAATCALMDHQCYEGEKKHEVEFYLSR